MCNNVFYWLLTFDKLSRHIKQQITRKTTSFLSEQINVRCTAFFFLLHDKDRCRYDNVKT